MTEPGPAHPSNRVDSPWSAVVPVAENRSARLAVRRVWQSLRSGRGSVPLLYLHGPPGAGKTALTQALTEAIVRDVPGMTLVSVAAAELVPSPASRDRDDDDIWAMHLPEARACGVLILEDLQHLPDRAIDSLSALLDARQRRRRPTILTALHGPAQWPWPRRLTSRLAGGLVVALDPWSRASRLKVLHTLTQRRRLALTDDVLLWLADHLSGNARPVLGALARLETLARQHPPPLPLTIVQAHWDDSLSDEAPIARIVRQVAGYFRVDPRRLLARDRHRDALWPRHVGMYLARQLTPLSLSQIGAYFGGRDHTTVRHACDKVEAALPSDAALARSVRWLRAELS